MFIKAGVLYNVEANDVVDGVLEIPEGVFRVNEGALNVVKNLYKNVKKLVIPASFVVVQENFFDGGTSLEEVEFKEGVQKIENNAFLGCTTLSKIKLPSTLTEIGNNAFENTNLNTLTLPQNVEIVGEFAFANNKNLEEVDLSYSKKLEVLNKETFSGCTNLKKIEFGTESKINTIKESVFTNTKLQSIKLPKNLKVMYASSVYGLNRIKRLNFTDGFEQLVGRLEIYNMKGLREVVLPSTIKRAMIYDDYGVAHKDFKVVIKQNNGSKIVNENLTGKRIAVNSNHHGIKAIYLQKEVKIVENNKTFLFGDIGLLKIKNLHMLLGEYKADTVYLWMKELKKHLGENILIYPKAEEISVIPVTRMDDYAKNRRIINEILKKTNHLPYESRKSVLKLALNLGILEQNQGVKNEVITMFREHVFNNEYFNSIHSISLNAIREKNSYEHNPKYNKLIKELFLNSKNSYYDLGTMIATATNNFDKIINFKRNPNIRTLEGYLKIDKYNIKNSNEFRIGEIAASLNIGVEEFDYISKAYNESLKLKAKNFVEHLAYKVKGEQFRDILSLEKYNLHDETEGDFVYEWLNKDNPHTAFLGYICDSCARINEVGWPILTASLVQENVQNLVVKDMFGAIIAKVTGVVDVKAGTMLFNSVEVDSNFLDKANTNDKEEVANAFRRGIAKMIKVYDSAAKELMVGGIKKVNMVMLHNKLRDVFEYGVENKYDKQPFFDIDFLGYPTDAISQMTLYNTDNTIEINRLETKQKDISKKIR